MKQISELTSSLEARLEKRRDDLMQMLSGELDALRPSLRKLFQSALRTIESDMSSRSSELSHAVQRISSRMGELEQLASSADSQASRGMRSLSEDFLQEVQRAMETMRTELQRALVERRKLTAALDRESAIQQTIKGRTGKAWIIATTMTMLAAGLLVASWLALSKQLQARDEAFKELELAQTERLEAERSRNQALIQAQWLSGVFVGREFHTATGSWVQLNPTRLGTSGANTYLRMK